MTVLFLYHDFYALSEGEEYKFGSSEDCITDSSVLGIMADFFHSLYFP